MSTTATAKRPLAEARLDARDFAELLLADSLAERWTTAGSVRRGVPHVGDVEHVVIPRFGEVKAGDSLFAETKTANLVWHRLDQLVAAGILRQHIYGATGPRWGDKYRGVDFRGFCHEIFTADPDNWGMQLAIRTGPPDFSRRLVTGLLEGGFRNQHGRVWLCDRCEANRRCPRECSACQGTQLVPRGDPIPAADEETYFKLCGVEWAEPRDRR